MISTLLSRNDHLSDPDVFGITNSSENRSQGEKEQNQNHCLLL